MGEAQRDVRQLRRRLAHFEPPPPVFDDVTISA